MIFWIGSGCIGALGSDDGVGALGDGNGDRGVGVIGGFGIGAGGIGGSMGFFIEGIGGMETVGTGAGFGIIG